MNDKDAIERIERELNRALDAARADLDRIEILSAAVCAFARPVPDYEPSFRHIRGHGLKAYQIGLR